MLTPPPIGIGMKPPGGGPPANRFPGDELEGTRGSPGSSSERSESAVDGNTRFIPLAISSGRSSSAIVGSFGEVLACGSTETWFPQRVRAVVFPSVKSFSPW